MNGNYQEGEERQLRLSERIGLFGAVLAILGEALALVAEVEAIEEARLDEREAQQQIDALKAGRLNDEE